MHPEAIEELLISEDTIIPRECSDFFLRILTRAQFERIAASVNPQGIMAVVRIPSDSYKTNIPSDPGKRILLLEDIQDPGNVGSMIRNAAAFDCSGVILSARCADPFGSKAAQSSAGAVLEPWIRWGEGYMDIVRLLKKKGYCVYGADLRGDSSVDFCNNKPSVLAFGNEGSGLSENLLSLVDVLFSIPMNRNAIESLNVAAAGAITLFAAYKNSGWGR